MQTTHRAIGVEKHKEEHFFLIVKRILANHNHCLQDLLFESVKKKQVERNQCCVNKYISTVINEW